jgi:hypothetical protein
MNMSKKKDTAWVSMSTANGTNLPTPHRKPPCRSARELPQVSTGGVLCHRRPTCSVDIRLGKQAFSAGSNGAEHTPITAATITICPTLATPTTSATTRVVAAITCAASQPSMTFLRFHRSTKAPAGKPAASAAAALVPSTSPVADADPVSDNTSSGEGDCRRLRTELRQRLPTPQ